MPSFATISNVSVPENVSNGTYVATPVVLSIDTVPPVGATTSSNVRESPSGSVAVSVMSTDSPPVTASEPTEPMTGALLICNGSALPRMSVLPARMPSFAFAVRSFAVSSPSNDQYPTRPVSPPRCFFR
jgi:hypothetical protein